MQRIRVRYRKEGRVRFVSARDLTSVWERALRRVDLPIAYSEGFTPHARVSFPDALPVGYASTGEYAELTFAAAVDPGPDLARLSATLPEGMDITTYVEVTPHARKLASLLPATLWELRWHPEGATTSRAVVELLRRRTTDLLDAAHAEVQRRRPDGNLKTLDVRPAVIALAPSTTDRSTVLRAVLRNDGPTIRPTDLHAALATGTPGLPEPGLYRRVAQGPPVPGGLTEALSGELVGLVPDADAEAA